jgi:ribosome-associated toxin RatA of RatAB toxin-antitoxin module
MKRDLQFKKVLKINADDALKVVSNFSKYADFVPGCTRASLISRNSPIEIGQLEFNILGKKYFIESRNEILENSINIEQIKGPFDNFNGKWAVKKIDKDFCEVCFNAQFELPFLLNAIIPQSLVEAFSSNIIESFIKEAQ